MPSKIILALFCLFTMVTTHAQSTLVVSSKRFTENYIVAEIFAQLLENDGYTVERRYGMGGTMMAYKALKSKKVDIYPEYTGTAAAAILKSRERNFNAINRLLKEDGVKMLPPLGFDNSYCAVIKKSLSEQLNIHSISDLSQHPELKGAFSFEFQERDDGWPAMKQVYGLKNSVKGIEVPLTYEALRNNEVDFVEAYTTEPLLKKYGFVVLQDDREFFPKYAAVAIVREDLPERVAQVLNKLSGMIDNDTIIDLNGKAVGGVPIPEVANHFLVDKGFLDASSKRNYGRGVDWDKLWSLTRTHISLTILAVFFAILVAVPLATLLAPYKRLSQPLLAVASILQTIPSIALLTFMIPFFGIGFLPAIVGLFIYSLLPILQNTHVAMTNIDPRLITAARGIGLYPSEVLWSVKLPLAFPTILAGIRTATILSIGTATLAAFIGAGGLGEPIVTGLALNDTSLVLQGAIPAATLAIVMDGLFALVNRFFVKNI